MIDTADAPWLILVYGDPGHGKTYLATQLETGYFFQRLSLDTEYVAFVEDKCPALHMDALRLHVGTHYDHILRNSSVEMFLWA